MSLIQYSVRFSLANDESVLLSNVSTVSCEQFESIYGFSRYRILFDNLDSSLGGKIAASSGALRGLLTLGCLSDAGELRGPQATFFVNEVLIIPQGGHQRVSITGSDFSYKMLNTCSGKSFIQKTTDVMVKELAQLSQLDTSGVQQVNPQPYTLRQCTMSDFEFITEVLAKRKGDDPLFCYVKQGNKLVFQKRKRGARLCTLSTDASGDAIPFVYCVSRMAVEPMRFGATTRTFDLLKQGKSQLLMLSEDDTTADYDTFGGQAPSTTLAPKGMTGAIELDVMDSLSYKSLQKELKVRSRWNPVTSVYRLAVPIGILPSAELGKQVTVAAKGADGQSVYYSGDYLLYAFKHTLKDVQQAGTILYLERRGMDAA